MKLISEKEFEVLPLNEKSNYVKCPQWSNKYGWLPTEMPLEIFTKRFTSLPVRNGYVLNIFHKEINEINGNIEVYKGIKLQATFHSKEIADLLYSFMIPNEL